MDKVLNLLLQAHQEAKNTAVDQLQNDQDIEQHVLDTIKSLYALIQAVKQASGL